MSNGIRTCIASTLVTLLLLSPSCSQNEPTRDPLAYTPTGDALWDTYAQALLEQLPSIRADFSVESMKAAILPDDLLAGWEADFGDDPRYWQMRFCNKVSLDRQATYQGWEPDMFEYSAGYTAPEPAFFLLQGKKLGFTDATTELLLYQYLVWRLGYLQENYQTGSQVEDDFFEIPQFDDADSSVLWFEEQRQGLVDKLVTDHPDESWTWYQRAMRNFNSGDWEAGLDDLQSGNQAKFNRIPICFPMSYIAANVGGMPKGGNETAAGIVSDSFDYIFGGPFTGFYFSKLVDSQLDRISDGSDLSELAAWHEFAIRYGTMKSISSGDWLAATLIPVRITRYLLTEISEDFTVEQRNALMVLNVRAHRLATQCGDNLMHEMPEMGGETEAIRVLLVDHGVDVEPSEIVRNGLDDISRYRELNIELHQLQFNLMWEIHVVRNSVLAKFAEKLFPKLSGFDFVTLSWPE